MLTILQWILLASILVPMLTLVGNVWMLRGIHSLKQERAPVSDKLLRSAVESLSKEIEKLDEQANDIFVWTFFGPALFIAIVILGSGAQLRRRR